MLLLISCSQWRVGNAQVKAHRIDMHPMGRCLSGMWKEQLLK